MSHSAEPWRVIGPPSQGKCEIVNDEHYPNHGIAVGVTREDANRIVACVNALEGIPTEWLADPDHWFPKVLRKVAPAIAEQELRKRPKETP